MASDDLPRLEGVALVTGAGRGLGRELALALARAGMRVGLLGRNRPTLDAALRECVGVSTCTGPRAVAVRADVTDRDAVRAAVGTVERDLGPVTLLVNNAGRIDAAEVPPWEAEPDDWWAVVEANLRGPFLLAREVVPGMVARGGGRVVNMTSGMGLRPVPAYSAYSVSKAALSRLTENFSVALAEHGVRVFDLTPGLVRTDMTASMPMWSKLPAEAWNQPAGVVRAVLAIASGRLDPLAGRFLHASRDDLDALLEQAERISQDDSRVLRLRPYGAGDPVA